MKYIDEYRNSELIEALAEKIREITLGNWRIMEICGGQTHTILKYNLESLLPKEINMLHGPGCPVCVTPLEKIDKAIQLAKREDVILTSFGDMLRVPGSADDFLSVKASGGDIRMVYSPLDAIKIAQKNRDRKVVFFGVGFETTAPANAMSVVKAKLLGLDNFSLLCSNVLVPPAIEVLMSAGRTGIDAVLAAGHVCTVMGYEEYEPLSERFKIPIIPSGFEPSDILGGIHLAVRQLENGQHFVENQYGRAVRKEGNIKAKSLLKEVFDVVDREWRGIGTIPNSGYKLKDEFSIFDAELVFDLGMIQSQESKTCIAGEILQGLRLPGECPAFATDCTPEHPLGAPMVSSEGACAAYVKYGINLI